MTEQKTLYDKLYELHTKYIYAWCRFNISIDKAMLNDQFRKTLPAKYDP